MSSETSGDITTSHKVIVGVALMVVVLVIITEVAGHNPQMGKAMLLLMIGPVLILGARDNGKFTTWAQGLPPTSGIQ